MENNSPNIQFTDNNQQMQQNSNVAKKLALIILVIMLLLLIIPNNPIYVFLHFAISAVIVLLCGSYFFSSKSYKAVKATGNAIKMVVHIIAGVILLIITAIVSWVVLLFVGLTNGSYSMSTYGTPIYRPKIK